MSALPLLTILKDGEKIFEREIERDISIGRDEGCVIRLEDRAISRKHALLRVVPDGLQIEKKSEFGSMQINGEQKTSALIKTGDLIAMGPYLIRVQMPEAEVVPTPTPVHEEVTTEELPSDPPVSVEAESSAVAVSSPIDAAVVAGVNPMDEVLAMTGETPVGANSAPSAEATPAENPFVEDGNGKTRVLSKATHIQGRLIFEDGLGQQKEFMIDRDVIVIGRSKECDLPIDDKRLSRRHVSIERQGLRFILKDLQTVNGSFINDVQVQEQELESGNAIRLGDTLILFEAINTEYAHAGIHHSASTSESWEDAEMPQQTSLPYLGSSSSQQTRSIAGISKSSDSNGSLIEKFKSLPPRKRMIYGTVILMMVFFLMEEDEPQTKKRVPASKVGLNQQTTPTFEGLSKKDKEFVSSQYQLAFDLYASKQYDKAIYEVNRIFELIPDFKDSRDILRYAEEGKKRMAAIEAEGRKREEEAKIRQRVAEFEEEISKLLLEKKYDEAVEMFPKIVELDPENANIEKWQAQVDSYVEKKKQEEAQKQLKIRMTAQAAGVLDDATALLNDKKYRQSINKFIGGLVINPVEDVVREKLQQGIEKAKEELETEMNPLLADAKQKEDLKEYAQAFKLFEKASVLDPEATAPKEGMERIRDTLHAKAKGLYTEGLLNESYSDFETAKQKFQETKDTAPTDDIYYQKAVSKLRKFELLHLAFPEAPRMPAAAGPPVLSYEDLQPGKIPGVPDTGKPKQEAAPATEPAPASVEPEMPQIQIPDFSQLPGFNLLQGGGEDNSEGAAP